MYHEAPTPSRPMSQAEVAKELRSALQVGSVKAKGGRMTSYEFVHGLGLQPLADAMADILCRYMVFTKKPPTAPHTTPQARKDK